jgi:hypothetical protein
MVKNIPGAPAAVYSPDIQIALNSADTRVRCTKQLHPFGCNSFGKAEKECLATPS